MTPRPPWHDNEQLIAMAWCALAAALYIVAKLADAL